MKIINKISLNSKIIFLILISISLVSCSTNETSDSIKDIAFLRNSFLGKGINFGNALEAPNEGDWGVVIQDEYFDIVKNLGFKSIRLPIKWSAHLNIDTIIEPKFFERVDYLINKSISKGIPIIINVHHFDEIFREPEKYKIVLYKIWNQIVVRYKNTSSLLYYEILNEPQGNLTSNIWNEIIDSVVKIVRKYDKNKTILIGSYNWSSIWGLEELQLPNDNNIIVSFHFYEPIEFTHQGAEWIPGSESWLGRKWPENENDLLFMREAVHIAVNWAKEKNVPLHCGEFGAYYKADSLSRIRWTERLVDLLDENNISFAYWEFCAGFGIYNPRTQIYDWGLINALIKKRTK